MNKTPLHQWHVENGANMAEFASYSMPLWYPEGVKSEHLSVIESCGLFDTSHMAVVLIRGEEGHSLLQNTFSKDLDSCIGASAKPLQAGRCVYGVFLDECGHVIDDAIVYKKADDLHMVVVNAGMGGPIADHLKDFAQVGCEIVDMTDRIDKIDIQGPAAASILSSLLENPEQVFDGLVYFSFRGWFDDISSVQLKDGTPVLLSRTGYTGEFGFELFLPPDRLEPVWKALLEAGGDRIKPCGLAARDSLRAGAVLPLSHQDIGDWPFAANPWQFALPLAEDGTFTKEFIGSKALQELKNVQRTYPFAGFDPRKIPAGESSSVLDSSGQEIGRVLTCTTDMAIDRLEGEIVSVASMSLPEDFRPKGLSCGFIRVQKELAAGDMVELVSGRRKIKVEVRQDVRPSRTARRPMKEMFEG